MSQNVSLSQQSTPNTTNRLENLFQSSTDSEPNFFDTLGSNAHETGIVTQVGSENNVLPQVTETSLPRHSSDLFLSSHTEEGDPLHHSASQGDLNVIPGFRNPLIGEHLQLTDSMQSIKLSQESLDELKVQSLECTETTQQAPDLANIMSSQDQSNIINNEAANESVSQPTNVSSNEAIGEKTEDIISDPITNTQKQWHPLKVPSVEGESKDEGTVGSTLQDHPNSFVNPAMTYGQPTPPGTVDDGRNNVFSNEVVLTQVL